MDELRTPGAHHYNTLIAGGQGLDSSDEDEEPLQQTRTTVAPPWADDIWKVDITECVSRGMLRRSCRKRGGGCIVPYQRTAALLWA